VQGVAQALQHQGLQVATCAPAQVSAGSADVLVAVGFDTPAATRLEAALAPALPVLWLGAAAPRPALRPTGLLAPDSDDTRLAAAVHALAAGLSVHDATHRATPLPSMAADAGEPLTPRELEVFELLAKGLNNRDIAQALGISSHTAKFHVAQILEKT